MRRNTAASIGLAALRIENKYPKATMLIPPSDHLILDNEEFLKTIQSAVELAEGGDNLVTIGTEPTNPETVYGYINYNQNQCKSGFEVNKFTGKPDLKRAIGFIISGDYLWNSGVFVGQVKLFLKCSKNIYAGTFQVLKNIREVTGTVEEKKLFIRNSKN